MPIIAFMSDFGLKDPYVAQAKMAVYRVNPEVHIYDLTHMVRPFCVTCASYILYSSIEWFPRDIVYLVVVDPGVGGPRKPLILSHGKTYFVGPDNGVFWPIVEKLGIEGFRAYEIKIESLGVGRVSSTFHGRDIFAPSAGLLSRGVEPSVIGRPLDIGGLVKLRLLEERVFGGRTCYRVVYVDRFGNMALSTVPGGISWSMGSEVIVERLRDGFRERAVVTDTFSGVEPGGTALYINSFGFLELSMYMGNLYKRHGYRIGDWVCLKSRS